VWQPYAYALKMSGRSYIITDTKIGVEINLLTIRKIVHRILEVHFKSIKSIFVRDRLVKFYSHYLNIS